MATVIAPNISFTFDELRYFPGLTKKDPEYDLSTYIDKDKKICPKIPLISSPMQTVSDDHLAIALAKVGGLGVIYCSQHIVDQVYMIEQVKNHKAAFVTKPVTIKEGSTIDDLINLYQESGYTHYPVESDSGEFKGFVTYSPIMELLSDSQKNSVVEIHDFGCLDKKLSKVTHKEVIDLFK